MDDSTYNHDKEKSPAVDHKERVTTNDSFYRIPSAAELRQLREMDSLQAGSLLRLQADGLVNSITPPELKTLQSTLQLEEEWIPMLSEVLAAIHSEHLEPKDLLPGFDIGVHNIQGGLNFSPPSEIEIVGSHALHCSIKPSGAPREVVSSCTFSSLQSSSSLLQNVVDAQWLNFFSSFPLLYLCPFCLPTEFFHCISGYCCYHASLVYCTSRFRWVSLSL